jgi:Domain of unknown function (DUF4926)
VKFSVLDVVALKVDLPNRNLRAGMIGTIIHVFHAPNLAFEVEFCDKNGKTVTQCVLLGEQLQLASRTGPTQQHRPHRRRHHGDRGNQPHDGHANLTRPRHQRQQLLRRPHGAGAGRCLRRRTWHDQRLVSVGCAGRQLCRSR